MYKHNNNNLQREVTLGDPTDILNRRREHFESLLNDYAHTEDIILQHVPQDNLRNWMALPPTVAEVSDALGKMRAGKSLGPNNLPIELILAGGGAAREALFQLIRRI